MGHNITASTESDLKEWLDTHGFPVPQPTAVWPPQSPFPARQLTHDSQRDKLIASVRRNSRLAYLRMQENADRSKKASHDANARLTDKLIDFWSESQLKEFCDKSNIPGAPTPQTLTSRLGC